MHTCTPFCRTFYFDSILQIPATHLQDLQPLQSDISSCLPAQVYMGLSISSMFAGLALQRWSPKHVCSVSLVLNAFACLLLTLSPPDFTMFLFSSRFGVGVFQSFFCIYAREFVCV